MLQRLQFGFRKPLPLVLQGEISECGLACVCMIANYHGYTVDMRTLRQSYPTSLKGATLANLIDISKGLELISRPLSLELSEIGDLHLPCILHWDFNHFVVLKKVGRDKVQLLDPAVGERKLSIDELSKHFTGVALELLPGVKFKRRSTKDKIDISRLVGRVIGIKDAMLKVFLLAVSIEVCTIVSPLFIQWVTDEALVTADKQLISTLCIGFALIWVFQSFIETYRAWIILHMGVSLNVQWLANVSTHLFRLPGTYFTKRYVGDIIGRINTVNTIQATLTTSVIEAILDGIMSAGTLAMMFLYAPSIATVSIAAVAIYCILRIFLYKNIRSANESQFSLENKQQTYLLESIRGLSTIKLFAKESFRGAEWINRLIRQKNAYLRVQRLLTLFHGANSLIFKAEYVVVVFLGAERVLDKSFSIGMLIAYLAYRDQFAKRISSLIDKTYEFKMLDVQLARLADVMQEKGEPMTDMISPKLGSAELSFSGVSFRHSSNEPYVIQNLSLRIETGEHVAIVGPSGCGKSTLLKIITGLYSPTSGKISIGGKNINTLGPQCYRSYFGSVMQDDNLFAGSIYENIAFFDEKIDDVWLKECAEIAQIANDIEMLPMGYNTLIGDMGSSLSGGQKQRILLARALYKRPLIIVLDEATSHLDVETEKKVNSAIKSLKITRIVVAHRQDTIANADRVIQLKKK